ncbi:hypothetical protein CesoFtcFv8_006647 [Champsocephalus esox]|uniref:Uncharacterized protein n=1 Tax=Champsocephalus esox TaxID=159716 RepID=A0AAN8H7R5_9TELE|nr:hypothetical protein CesoFtcFv8_006647 [Champsocephalus esox]
MSRHCSGQMVRAVADPTGLRSQKSHRSQKILECTHGVRTKSREQPWIHPMTHALQEKPLCRSFSALFLLDREVYVCSGLPSFVLYTQSAKQPSARQLAD